MKYTFLSFREFYLAFGLMLLSLCVQASVTIIDVVQTQEICNLSNGTITITAVGEPGATLFYSIDGGGTWQESPFFDGLESNDYDILVADSTGSCSQDFTFQVTAADTPQIDVTPTCITGSGNIDIDLMPFMSGIPPFTFAWTGPTGTYNTEDLSDVPTGQYSVSVQDAFGCQIDTSFFVPVCCAMQIDCTPVSTTLNCIADYEEITSMIFDTIPSADRVTVLSDLFGIEVMGDPCNDITVMVTNQEIFDQDCSSGPMVVNSSIEISDGVSTVVCERIYEIDNYLGLEFLMPAVDLEVSCDQDYQTMLQDFVDDVAGAEIRSCSDAYTITTDPANPSLDFTCTSESIDITFIIADACGNQDSTMATFSVVDNNLPTIACPDDLMLMVGEDNALAIANWLDAVESMDNCSATSDTNDFDVNNLDETCDGSSLQVLFTATDGCANQVDCSASIIYVAMGQPVITCPQDIVLQCSGTDLINDVNLWLDSASATDGNPIMVSHNFDASDVVGLECGGSLDILFEATTVCGSVNCMAQFAVTDNQAPELVCPDGLFVSYDDAAIDMVIEDWLAQASATDDCSPVQVIDNYLSDQLSLDCQGSELVVDFEVEDNCSNRSTCTSLITVVGGQGGNLVCPAELVINCGEPDYINILEAWIAESTAEDDNANMLTVANNFVVSDFENLLCDESLEVEFFVNENCIDLSCLSRITSVDTEDPKIICPNNISLVFGSDSFSDDIDGWLDEVEGLDNCSAVSIEDDLSVPSQIDCDDNVVTLVEFVATDDCSNVATCVSELTILTPSGLPSLMCPGALILNCGEEIGDTVDEWMALNTAQDENGNDIAIDNDLDMLAVENLTCGESLDVTFSIAVICGNLDCQSSIQLVDSIEPEIFCPDPLIIPDFENLEQRVGLWLESISATDNCTAVAISHDFDTDLSSIDCPEELEVSFTASDECQNVSSCVTSVSLGDLLAIDLECPSSVTLQCSEVEPETLINNILQSVTVESFGEYDLQYAYSADVSDLSCDAALSFDVEIFVVGMCDQEEDCFLSVIIEPEPTVYIPNVSSPSLRGQEVVTVYGNSIIEEVEEFYIYDRWGELVYEARNFEPNDESMGWNGNFTNAQDDSAVYTYYTVVRTTQNEMLKYVGDITLLR